MVSYQKERGRINNEPSQNKRQKQGNTYNQISSPNNFEIALQNGFQTNSDKINRGIKKGKMNINYEEDQEDQEDNKYDTNN